MDEGKRLTEQKLLEALGEAPQEIKIAYNLLLGLSTHDLSAMRELLGTPKGVLYAAARAGGLYITAAFDYGDFVCQFETGIDAIPRFDCYLEVYGKSQHLRVDYQTPYVRHLATKLGVVTAASEGNLHVETVQPAFEDNFTREWQAFLQKRYNGGRAEDRPRRLPARPRAFRSHDGENPQRHPTRARLGGLRGSAQGRSSPHLW